MESISQDYAPAIAARSRRSQRRFPGHRIVYLARRTPLVGNRRTTAAGLKPSRTFGRRARLAHLSDLHIGPQVDDSYLASVFERVRSLAPEIVVYTGDFTSYSTDVLEHARHVFPSLPTGTRATFGILGNHDHGPNWAHPEAAHKIADLAQSAGVRMLRNEVAEFDGLQMVGLDDLWANQFKLDKALAQTDPSSPAIALTHNPDTADQPGWETFTGWILAGHTHGGQCKAPFLPPPMLPVKNRRYTSGEFDLSGGRRMYISRGVGHLLRVRFNVCPEVTIFQLAKA